MKNKKNYEESKLYDLFINDIDAYIRKTESLSQHQVIQVCMPVVVRFQQKQPSHVIWWVPIFGNEIFEIPYSRLKVLVEADTQFQIMDQVIEIISDEIFQYFKRFRSFSELRAALEHQGFRARDESMKIFDFTLEFEKLIKIFKNQIPDYMETTTFKPEVAFT